MNEKASKQQGSERVIRPYGKNQMSDDIDKLLHHGRQMHDAAVYGLFSRFGRFVGRAFGIVKHEGRERILPKRPRRHGWVG